MKKNKMLLLLMSGTILLAGCAGGAKKPTTTALTYKPFTIKVPKGLEYESNMFKGVFLKDYKYIARTSGDIPDFNSVEFRQEPSKSELKTVFCEGTYYRNLGSYDKSCVTINSKVSVSETDSNYVISIRPYNLTSKQGRNGLFIPIDLPKVSEEKWYKYISRQSVYFKQELTSKYPSASLKANFDRSLSSSSWKPQEKGSLQQFKDSYMLSNSGTSTAVIAAAFYPYKEGSMVEVKYHLGDYISNSSKDWGPLVRKAKDKVASIVAK